MANTNLTDSEGDMTNIVLQDEEAVLPLFSQGYLSGMNMLISDSHAHSCDIFILKFE